MYTYDGASGRLCYTLRAKGCFLNEGCYSKVQSPRLSFADPYAGSFHITKSACCSRGIAVFLEMRLKLSDPKSIEWDSKGLLSKCSMRIRHCR